MPDLGQLETVDLRAVWSDEARDFTPWLANENLELLAETIGLDLELEGTEKSVGRFKADILCRDTVDDQWVLVENQLDRTDHGHLGQLLTYASGLGAVTIVWVSNRFSDEHRSALDWLNEVTEEGIDFFGLEIELWKIEGSPPAPKLNVVSKPNDWSKQVATAARQQGELSEVEQTQLEYWTQFNEYLGDYNDAVQTRKPQPMSEARFAVGRTGATLMAKTNSYKNSLRVGIYLRKDAEALFHLLKQQADEVEAEVGYDLEWLPRPEVKQTIIRHEWEGHDPLDESAWQEQFKILSDALTAFHDAFRPRLQDLDPDDWEEEERPVDGAQGSEASATS
jgi:hypothetical protein